MKRLISQFGRILPGQSPVSRLEETARLFMSMRGDINNFRVTRIDDDMIHEQAGAIEIHQEPPIVGAVCRSVDLAIECAYVEPVGIIWIHHQTSNIATGRSRDLPLSRIRRTG